MRLEEYAPLVGLQTLDRLRAKAAPLDGARVAHVNATYVGGGVAELLLRLVPLFNELGLSTEWRILRGTPAFFGITKDIHNALQGEPVLFSEGDWEIYQRTIAENAVWNKLDHDVVIVHDPQPLGLVDHYPQRGRWIWRCHIDMTEPHDACWQVLRPYVGRYDAAITTLPEYQHSNGIPYHTVLPAIDPFTEKNRPMTEAEVDARLQEYGIPTDLPLVVQVSRFDPWKDPRGVVEAMRLVREHVDARLVLLGNLAHDDPEGEIVYDEVQRLRDDRTLVVCVEDSLLVNALQRRADVVVQKSLREGFGLTVSEALWKGTPVVGGAVGGIRHQIEDGVNGYLVSTIEECADRIVRLLQDAERRRAMGEAGRERVRERFLITRLVEDYLDILAATTGAA